MLQKNSSNWLTVPWSNPPDLLKMCAAFPLFFLHFFGVGGGGGGGGKSSLFFLIFFFFILTDVNLSVHIYSNS